MVTVVREFLVRCKSATKRIGVESHAWKSSFEGIKAGRRCLHGASPRHFWSSSARLKRRCSFKTEWCAFQASERTVLMPKTQPASTILDQLARSNEIHLTVTGRKTGRKSTRPVWFVFENGTLYLLPVSGSDTQWYKNVPDHPDIEVEVHKAKGTFRAVPVTDPQEVKNVVEKF